jgi:hypothetical protein
MTLLLPLLYYLYFFSTFTADQEFDVQNDYYTAIYCRMLPYLIGIMAGYYLWRMRGKELNIHWTTNLVIWAAALSVGWMCVFGLFEIRSTNTFMKPSYSRKIINQT